MEAIKIIILLTTIVMPQQSPDIHHQEKMTNSDECWAKAKKFAETELSDDLKQMGALGRTAGCMFVTPPKADPVPEKPDDSF